jgi:hypothetical protein
VISPEESAEEIKPEETAGKKKHNNFASASEEKQKNRICWIAIS